MWWRQCLESRIENDDRQLDGVCVRCRAGIDTNRPRSLCEVDGFVPGSKGFVHNAMRGVVPDLPKFAMRWPGVWWALDGVLWNEKLLNPDYRRCGAGLNKLPQYLYECRG